MVLSMKHTANLIMPVLHRQLCCLCVCTCAFITSCSDGGNQQYGVVMNTRRMEVGLPEVPATWTRRAKPQECVWLAPSSLQVGVASYHKKKMAWDGTGPTWEEDTFYSGSRISLRPIDPDAGMGWESLVCRYSYASTNGAWVFFLTSTNGLREVDVSSAMECLRRWGLTHPLQKRVGNNSDGT